MKRFWLFGGAEEYYASGGLCDFLGDFDTLEEAQDLGRSEKDWNRGLGFAPRPEKLAWWHVFDTQERDVVYQSGTAFNQTRMCSNTVNLDETKEIVRPYGLQKARALQ